LQKNLCLAAKYPPHACFSADVKFLPIYFSIFHCGKFDRVRWASNEISSKDFSPAMNENRAM
jgi:hypothetical protein